MIDPDEVEDPIRRIYYQVATGEIDRETGQEQLEAELKALAESLSNDE
jgi:flagellar biosynthesis regulator FlbT